MNLRPGVGRLAATVAAANVALVAYSCVHDWDQYLPEGQGGTAASGGGTPTGGEGAGSSQVVGTCPTAMAGSPELVRVPSPDHVATCVGRTEVTRGQYEDWLTDAGDGGPEAPTGYPNACNWEEDFRPGHGVTSNDWPTQGLRRDHPVYSVNWCQALAFCLAHGQRLCGTIADGGAIQSDGLTEPTVSEWYNACTEGGQHAYPYGDSYEAVRCNGQRDGGTPPPTTAVGSMAACRPAGLPIFDLSGNVWEWENSCTGTDCYQRGGGWNATGDSLSCIVTSQRAMESGATNIGFRCCANPILDGGGEGGSGGGTSSGTATGTQTGTSTGTTTTTTTSS